MNHVLRPSVFMATILLSLPFAAESRGELITVHFAGTVTSVTRGPSVKGFDFPDVGDPFIGFYKFDSTAQDLQPQPDTGVFGTTLSDIAIGVTIGDFQFEGFESVIFDRHDFYDVGGAVELTSNAALAQIIATSQKTFSLNVSRSDLLSDPNILPLSPPPLENAIERQLAVSVIDLPDGLPPNPFTIVATLDSLTVVPEPSSWLLMGIAVFVLPQSGSRRQSG